VRGLAPVLVFLSSVNVGAQDLPDKPQPNFGMVRVDVTYSNSEHPKAVERLTLKVPHKTEDRAWWTWQASSLLITGGDLGFALSHLRQEANPLIRKHPAAMTGVVAATSVAVIYVSRKWKRQDDALRAAAGGERGIKWWVPNAVETAFHGAGLVLSLTSMR
jgi:hypothetical protein